jgi:hypothetical protein
MKNNDKFPKRPAFQIHSPINAKPKRPTEVPVPGKNPEIIPAEEPEPNTWPKKNPEIQPEKEPLTVPPTAPPEVPKPPESAMNVSM